MGQSTIVRGRIDLIYRHGRGWKVVDYKTDRARTGADVERLRRLYEAQVKAYARRWKAITGETVIEAGLWLTESGRWLSVL